MIQPLDIGRIKKDSHVWIIGRQNTGKSFLIRDILFQLNLTNGIVVYPNEPYEHFYESFVSKERICEEYTPTLINHPINDFIVFDNCFYRNTPLMDPSIQKMLLNRSDHSILWMIALPAYLYIPPQLRSTIDYVFILRDNLEISRRRLYSQFSRIFPTFESFNEVMDECTKNYECLVIADPSQAKPFKECVYRYKATKTV